MQHSGGRAVLRQLARRQLTSAVRSVSARVQTSPFHSYCRRRSSDDPRLKDEATARVITDDFATVRQSYEVPKHAIVLAHGLLGFDELHIVPAFAGWRVPGIQYWSGITEALTAKGASVIIASVPPSGSIEHRAARLAEKIKTAAEGKAVNIIAHSMGGLDARYMISRLQPEEVKILSLTTIATPHHGSTFADYMFEQLGPTVTSGLYTALAKMGVEDTAGFAQLTQKYMRETFNPAVPDDPTVQYFSYGAQLHPHLTSVFRLSHGIITKVEGENDGLVSVESSKWGEYKGTLENVSHLDTINWTNKFRWWAKEVMLGAGGKQKFNAIAFYLAIADMLAKEGL